MSQTELVRELEGFAFGRKMPMGSRSYQTQKATSEDVALITLAGSTGLEPATSDVTGRRSNQTELTPQAVVRVCFRSRALRGLVYTEVCPARNNFFEKIFGAIREALRGWGRGLSLLLYSPAQDGKHIKCFPLRAELATNLTPAPSPGEPPCRHFVRVVVVPRRFRGSRSPFSSAGLSKVVAEALPLAQRKTGDAICIPRFCCGYSKSINLVLRILPSFTSILAMVGPRVPLG